MRVAVTLCLIAAVLVRGAIAVTGAAETRVRALAAAEREPFLRTLHELVSIDSGSRDPEGLARIAALIGSRLRSEGGEVRDIEPENTVRFEDTPDRIGRAVLARFHGTGTARILLLAHMDTVYEPGAAARQPFRIDGDRAYGAGVADDKHGVALLLHTLAILRALDFRSYGTLTVLINGDEEISSPGSRALISRLGREHDAVLSCESGGRPDEDRLQLATAGLGDVILKVSGRASHAGVAPEEGRNALYELAHQILQLRDLSNPAAGLKVNWTVASAGTVRNVIPSSARAVADVRVLRMEDFDALEQEVRRRTRTTLVPDTEVAAAFERRRPPLVPTDASRALGERARRIYAEIGRPLTVSSDSSGGGTDAAIAAMDTRAAVVEGFGLPGYGMHSDDAEFVVVSAIEPRLYLLVRMIMELSL